MAVSISTAGLSVPVGTTIASITNNTATLSNPVTGSSGSATFVTTGATDTTADGGGIRIKGTTDKSITYVNATTALTSTEHFDLATGKAYRIGNVQIANGNTTTLGPTTGAWSIGAGVTSSSLTSVGTLTSLTVSGTTTINGTNNLTINNGNLVIGTSGKGIDFSATANSSGTMTSELLADYEEGTWTPGISGRTVTNSTGWYTKVGRYVTVQFVMDGLNTPLSGSDVLITGLPFTPANISQVGAAVIADTSGVSYAVGYGDIYGRINSSTTSIQLLQKLTNGSNHDSFTGGGGISATFVLRGMAWYIV
jgi:hypothetical protein